MVKDAAVCASASNSVARASASSSVARRFFAFSGHSAVSQISTFLVYERFQIHIVLSVSLVVRRFHSSVPETSCYDAHEDLLTEGN